MGKVSKKRFDVIKRKVQDTKNNNLQARPNRGDLLLLMNVTNYFMTQNIVKLLMKKHRREQKIFAAIFARFDNLDYFTKNQVKLLNTLFMVNEIFTGKLKSLEQNSKGNLEVFQEKSDKEKQESDEQPDNTDMLSEQSAEQNKKQRGVQLKILKLDQVLSRLPNTLTANNSQKLKNEIRQLLYSLYCSKKLTKTIYNNFINIILK